MVEMTGDDVKDRTTITKTLMDIIGVIAPDADLSDIKPDIRLRDQLDMDSMDFLDIVMELRKRHKIGVEKEDYLLLSTINSSVDYLVPKFRAVYPPSKS